MTLIAHVYNSEVTSYYMLLLLAPSHCYGTCCCVLYVTLIAHVHTNEFIFCCWPLLVSEPNMAVSSLPVAVSELATDFLELSMGLCTPVPLSPHHNCAPIHPSHLCPNRPISPIHLVPQYLNIPLHLCPYHPIIPIHLVSMLMATLLSSHEFFVASCM